MNPQSTRSRSLSPRRSTERRPSNQPGDLVIQIDNAQQQRFPNSLEIPSSPVFAESPRSLHSSLSLEPRNVEEDVCFPSNHNTAANGFDLSAVNDLEKSKLDLQSNFSEKLVDDIEPFIHPTLKKSESHHSNQRKFSLYKDNNTKPTSMVTSDVERYLLFSPTAGSFTATNLYKLLMCETGWDSETVKASEIMESNHGWWLDIFAPTDEEMRVIGKMFHIHPLTIEDIQTQESREKCEIFQSYMFVSVRSFIQDSYSGDFLKPFNYYTLVFKQCAITIHFHMGPETDNVRNRMNQLKDFIVVTPEWVNYALIDDITDAFAPLIQQIEMEVDSIDDLVLLLRQSEQSDMLRRIGSCRKQVMQLTRLLASKSEVVKALIKRSKDKSLIEFETTEETKTHHDVFLFLGDIQDHIITMLQNLNQYDSVLARSHSNYLAQINIELSQLSNGTNKVVNRLTFFATMAIPLNIVAGLFGMNVKIPGVDNHDYVFFTYIVGSMVLFVAVSLYLAKRWDLV
ncbi:hypothetical protein BGW37DRAFT_503092 [Umbelopsis sp. PMI_123]|nr:hypothetical protein BGW37DRAFT_503092 [Umbelopsis sp. PMI_123]